MSAEAFLEHIREHPEDAVRLIYADWLEDHAGRAADRARAEFIRAQCRLTAGVADPDERLALADRARRLEGRHRDSWLRPLRGLVENAEFRRGFVERAEVDAETFLDHGDELFAAEPVSDVCFVRLQPEHLPTLATRPWLGHVRRLEMQPRDTESRVGRFPHNPPLPAEALAALFGSPFWHRLTELDLSLSGLRRPEAEALAAAPGLARLERLELDRCMLGDDGLAALAASPHLTRLTALLVRGNMIGRPGIQALAHARGLPGLAVLDLSENDTGPPAAEALATSPLLGRLRELTLDGRGQAGRLGDEGLAALAAAPGLAGLTVLRLGSCGIGADGVEGLSRSPHTAALHTLELGRNELGEGAAAPLARAPFFPRLRRLGLGRVRLGNAGLRALLWGTAHALGELDLSGNGLDEEAARRLAPAGLLGRLTELNLAENDLGPAGVTALAAAEAPNLRRLDLGHNNLGVEGVRALAGASFAAGLNELHLHWNVLGDEGAAVLAGSANLRRLTTLNLKANQLGDAAAAALAASPHLAHLTLLDVRGNRFGFRGRRALTDRFTPEVVRV
jgi:uncharacterized protein (TIGR02996 family)